MAIDPVCKMEVNEKEAAATSDYQGRKYYFCAVGCQKVFDKEPEKYLQPKRVAAAAAVASPRPPGAGGSGAPVKRPWRLRRRR